MSKKEYKAVKNYLHNEVGLNQQLIKEISEDYIQKSINKMIADKLDSNYFQSFILRIIGQVITGEKTYGGYWDNEKKCIDFIKKTINETVKQEVAKRINFEKIDLNIK